MTATAEQLQAQLEQLQAKVARFDRLLARRKCYLIAHIDPETMQVTGVHTYSDPPWGLTRVGVTLEGKLRREILAIILETEEETFHEAHETMRRIYPTSEPDLAARFPLPEPEPSGALCAAIVHRPDGWGSMEEVGIGGGTVPE